MGNVKHVFTSPKADGGDATQVRPSNWNAAHEGAVEILDRDLTQIDVANNAAETSIYSFSIPADVMGADGGVRLKLTGDMLQDTVATALVMRMKLGVTTILISTSRIWTQAVPRYKWTMDVLIMNSAVAVQKASAEFQAVADGATWAAYAGDSSFTAHAVGHGSATEDSSGALTLEVTVDWSAASVSASFRKEMALLELIPAI